MGKLTNNQRRRLRDALCDQPGDLVNALDIDEGEANTASNLGSGIGVFAEKIALDLRFKSLVAGSNVTIDTDGEEITINASGGDIDGVNLGSGQAIFVERDGNNLLFKTLVAGTGITLDDDEGDEIVINSTGGDVVGPNASQDGQFAIYDGLTGKLLKVSTFYDNGGALLPTQDSSYSLGNILEKFNQLFLAAGLSIGPNGESFNLFWDTDRARIFVDTLEINSAVGDDQRMLISTENITLFKQLSLVSGEAAALALNFAEQTNTGIFLNDDGTFAIAAFGNSALTIGGAVIRIDGSQDLSWATDGAGNVGQPTGNRPNFVYSLLDLVSGRDVQSATGIFRVDSENYFAITSTQQADLILNNLTYFTVGGAFVILGQDQQLSWGTDGGGNIGSPTDGRPGIIYAKNQIIVGDGLVNAPSYSFLGDPTGGIYLSSGVPTISSGGVNSAQFGSAGINLFQELRFPNATNIGQPLSAFALNPTNIYADNEIWAGGNVYVGGNTLYFGGGNGGLISDLGGVMLFGFPGNDNRLILGSLATKFGDLPIEFTTDGGADIGSRDLGSSFFRPNNIYLKNDLDAAGNIIARTAGKGLKIKEGADAKMGLATLTAGTVTVPNTTVSATSRIELTCQDANGGVPGVLVIANRVDGVSFDILSNNPADTGIILWHMLESA